LIRSIEEALHELQVTSVTLSDEERGALDEQGYLLLYDVIDSDWLGKLRDRYEELMEQEGANAGIEVHQEQGTRRLAELVNKGEVFDRIWTHPKVLACVHHVIKREFKLSSLNGRDAIPGQGLQQLHPDWGARNTDEPYHVVNSIWMLDDFTATNGATRVVPGTHRLRGTPADYMENPADSHPDEIIVTAPAGSVVVINSHLWHGGTLNRTNKPRRALHSYYTAREHRPQSDFRESIRLKTYRRLSAAARYILDVEE
jgi:ectoine hydroxylase-related dioxygenase (phytanoyl-CoA dioxygenase family)